MSEGLTGTTANDGQGIFFIVLAEVLLALVNTIVKYVHTWSTQKMMIVRNSVDGLLCILMWAYFRYEAPGLKVVALCLIRGMCYITFVSFFWASLKSCLPLGDVVSIVTAASPLFLVMLTRLLLGEKIPKMWPLQFVLCSFGVLLINKPLAPDEACPATTALLPMGAALAGGFMNLASRSLKNVPPAVLCVHNDVVALIYATVYQSVNSEDNSILPPGFDRNVLLLIVAGCIGWAGLLSNIRGYQGVSVAAIASIASYASVPLGYTIQVLVFGVVPDIMSVAGASLVICTNVFAVLLKRAAEQKLKQDELRQQLLATEEGKPA